MGRRPHKLDLYRLAVQHPQAEVNTLLKIYARHRRGSTPKLLREDFAGTAAVAIAWVELHPDHRAIAVELHPPTLAWARRRARRELGRRTAGLRFVRADSRRITPPRVTPSDITVALNFSLFVFHKREQLVEYFRNVRRGLARRGLFVFDVYGGPGAHRLSLQRRRVMPRAPETISPFDYIWQQRGFDALTHRVDNRIHFRLGRGSRIDNAFRYDWRLWTLPELADALGEAGFARSVVWSDRFDPATGCSDGQYRPLHHFPPREDWVAYVVAEK